MNTEELKQTINNKTGIPINLLTGSTEKEIIEQAKSLLEYRATTEQKQQTKGSTSEQFARWLSGSDEGQEEQIKNKVAEDIRSIIDDVWGYPSLSDKETQIKESDIQGATTQEKFENWFKAKTSYNPYIH